MSQWKLAVLEIKNLTSKNRLWYAGKLALQCAPEGVFRT
jgi:hypothetical protein